MESYSTLKNRAIDALRNNWLICVASTLVMCTISGFLSYTLVGLFFVVLPIEFGYRASFLNFIRNGNYEINDLFLAFKSSEYMRVVGTKSLQSVYIFLWSLLFVIPGIVKAYSYSLVSYILADTDLKYDDAIDRSRELMRGHKMELFLLHLSFIGWIFAAFFTCGIGFYWLNVYIEVTNVQFYNSLLANERQQFV